MATTLKVRLLFILLFTISPVSMADPQCHNPQRLVGLLGEWQSNQGDTLIKEQWRKVSDSTFEGFGATYRNDGSIMSTESMRIVLMSDRLFFVAKVSHNPLPVAFKLSNCSNDEFRFENTDHDFPTSLTYNLINSNQLRVTVMGNDNKGFILEFTKQKEG